EFLPARLALHQSSRYQQQRGSGLQHSHLRFVGGVGKKPERKVIGGKKVNRGIMFQQAGRVARIAIGDCADQLVEAADKCRRVVHSARGGEYGAVQQQRKLGHAVVVVAVVDGKQARHLGAKNVLHCGGDLQSRVALAREVKQGKRQARGANLQELVEVSSHPRKGVFRADLDGLCGGQGRALGQAAGGAGRSALEGEAHGGPK